LKTNEGIKDAPDAIDANITAGKIEFKNITFTYDN